MSWQNPHFQYQCCSCFIFLISCSSVLRDKWVLFFNLKFVNSSKLKGPISPQLQKYSKRSSWKPQKISTKQIKQNTTAGQITFFHWDFSDTLVDNHKRFYPHPTYSSLEGSSQTDFLDTSRGVSATGYIDCKQSSSEKWDPEPFGYLRGASIFHSFWKQKQTKKVQDWTSFISNNTYPKYNVFVVKPIALGTCNEKLQNTNSRSCQQC